MSKLNEMPSSKLQNKKVRKEINETSKTSQLWIAGGVLTIIKSIRNYKNLAYLLANTYDLNFIKIGGIWFLGGQKHLY